MDPSTELRYRRLTSRRDPFAVDEAYESIWATANPLLNHVMAEAAAVRAVSAQEGTGTIKDLVLLLSQGKLSPRDLVELPEGWIPFEDAPPFADVCEPLVRRRELRRRVLIALAIAAGLGFAAFIYAIGIGRQVGI